MQSRDFLITFPDGFEIGESAEYVDVKDGCLIFSENVLDTEKANYELTIVSIYPAGSWVHVADVGDLSLLKVKVKKTTKKEAAGV